ncbi:MAG: TolC family protein [Planctomycetales bacterium]|nr:TolC family protein [Planctomycetales bacterium]
MNRQVQIFTTWALCVLTLVSGCKPTQPFFLSEDGNLFGKGDLSHYMDVATQIEYPDVNEPSLDEVCSARPPLTLSNAEDYEFMDVTLQEVTRITLANSKVIRQLGGRISDAGSNIANTTPITLTGNGVAVATSYDPALAESGNGTSTGSQYSGTGVEAALAEFDAKLDSSINWGYVDRPQNFGGGIIGSIFANEFRQDTGKGTLGITKTTASGGTLEFRNNTIYDLNNNGSRAQPSDWLTNFEAAFTQPLLQGAGTQYNRIAGPFSFQQSSSGFANQIDGVVIARIRHDITLTTFEQGIRDLMRDVEDAYWELYFTYRDLEARKIGRDSALETWRRIKSLGRVGAQGGEASNEAQARSQYFLFRSQAEAAQTNLFRVENRLRYMMGLAVSDGRLFRPIDEPTTAQVRFDWTTIHCEALARRSELRSQRWEVKKRELELIASRNHLLPRLDAVGRYRWLGAGDDLINSSGTGAPPFLDGSNAFEVLTTGNYQEWELGVQLSMPIGFRRAMVGVRHHQLLLARERSVLEDMELEVSHQLGDAVRDIDLNYATTQTHFNRRVAAIDEVDAVRTLFEVGNTTLDQLLDAQRRRSEADSAYYRSLVDYNRAIMRAHHRKGSLLEYNGVYLAEGPWPGKAYFDALRRARQRDASTYLDYGFTRPNVISRGPYGQITHQSVPITEIPTPVGEETPLENPADDQSAPAREEVIPTPDETDSTPPTTATSVHNNGLAALPAVEDNAFGTFGAMPANYQQQPLTGPAQAEPLVVPRYLPQAVAPLPEPSSAPNPYRTGQVDGNLESAVNDSDNPPALNPLRHPEPLRQAPLNWIREQPPSTANEAQANRTTAETSANSASR